MVFKNKIIGTILVILGALPFLLKIENINNIIGKYTFLLPGEYIYQVIIIALGLFLLVKIRHKVQIEPRRQ